MFLGWLWCLEKAAWCQCVLYIWRGSCLTHKQRRWSLTLWKSHPCVNNSTNIYHCLPCSKHLCCRSVNTDFQVCVCRVLRSYLSPQVGTSHGISHDFVFTWEMGLCFLLIRKVMKTLRKTVGKCMPCIVPRHLFKGTPRVFCVNVTWVVRSHGIYLTINALLS